MLQQSTHIDVSSQQRLASDPCANVYVSASAGTGKTKVLCDRVIRLMLSGSDISNILCLTFTNAAAAEMTHRVVSRIKEWNQISDDDLAGQLEDLLGQQASLNEMTLAKGLYSKYLESYSKIKIQTIHSLCNSILQKEPSVRASLNIIESHLKNSLIKKAIDTVLELEDEKIVWAKNTLADFYDYQSIKGFFLEILANKIKFLESLDNSLDIYALYGADKNNSIEKIEEELVNAIPVEVISFAKILLESGEKIGSQILEALNPFEFSKYKSCYFTTEGKERARLLKKSNADRHPGALKCFEGEQQRIKELEIKKNALISANFQEAFAIMMGSIFKTYESLKASEDVIEYDDLLIRTIDILKGGQCEHILKNLDYVIDHLLVDEAQDLSPLQWELIKVISDEFFAGAGARDIERTLFVVGDYKQSIYSFQGANPDVFLNIKNHFSNKVSQAQKMWREVDLNTSFRSTAPVLEAVDKVFSDEQALSALGMQDELTHVPFRESGGHVQRWDLVQKQRKEKTTGWKIPSIEDEIYNPKKIVAEEIAEKVSDWVLSGRKLLGRDKRVEPRDVLILLRKRSDVLYFIINEVRKSGVEISDADRFKIQDEIIIQDILSLAKFVALPDDDLNLACLLKSPFFGVTEDKLYKLAHGRQSSIWQRIKSEDEELKAKLNAYITKARNLSLQEFFIKVIEGSRDAFLTRMGDKCPQIFNYFYDVLQKYISANTPTMDGFIYYVENSELDIQVDVSQSENKIRIMTVHASKGLQAPIVILADTASTEYAPHTNIYWHEGNMFFSTYKEFDTPYLKVLKDIKKQKDKEESMRLLYVAMTRAEDELYVMGWENNRQENSWYSLMGEQIDFVDAKYSYSGLVPTQIEKKDLPGFLTKPYKSSSTQVSNIKASKVASIKTPEIIRGEKIHQLLDVLPRMSKEQREQYIANDEFGDIALGVVNKFPEIFGPNSISELHMISNFSGKRVNVRMDRVIVEDEKITIIDYKTGVEDIESYQEQMALYKKVAKKKWPGREVEAKILWVDSLNLQDVANSINS